MAEQSAQDVVTRTQSVGDLSPSDAPATTTNADFNHSGEVKNVDEVQAQENGIHNPHAAKGDDFEDASGRSDTDGSRADGSVADDKPAEAKTVKKFPAAKPVSFAKYAVPKAVAANATTKPADRVSTPNSSASSLQQIGRPRLVAKTASSLQQQAKAYKPVAPDPMQVWNKNRVTPQASAKHLTDEELKQQYGIHLTSRLQADAEGKESKWADIDDDEDDWAPETIEWNDGTKTTLAAADLLLPTAQPSKVEAPPSQLPQPDQVRPRPPQFTSSVGPNATVLKLGASAERQQAQRAANEKARSPLEKKPAMLSRDAPAPTPAKSPWAALPPVDKVSPIAINPQPMAPPPARYGSYSGYGQSPSNIAAPSPAKEISADDFNRSWKNSPTNQPRELFMPSSGRYEAVPEGRRRMSKNDQNFRASAVLQRPGQSDSYAPAEPSSAFQTSRNSTDIGRRRASSIMSGGSGQVARRLSIVSGDAHPPVFEAQDGVRPTSQDGPPSQTQTPSSYQARGPSADYMSAGAPPAMDIEAEREKQKIAMKERIEAARQRKQDEEARLEAEKRERIAKRLAALPPLPTKDEEIAKKAEAEVAAKIEESVALEQEVMPDSAKPGPVTPAAVSYSPPKPPQPLATGEPQQYGLMKVHALDAVKKKGPAGTNNDQQKHVGVARPDLKSPDELAKETPKVTMPSINGVKAAETQRQNVAESLAPPEPSPKLSKPTTAGSDARGGWGDIRDHRSPPSGNLWGIPSNKALGNGTFDQGLAGYAPQDLSRTSSTAQGWINGRTPVGGRSPQPQHAAHTVQDARVHPQPPFISPDQTPLAADSEADVLFPTVRPAPIAPPQTQNTRAHVNGIAPTPHANGNLVAWNNFHQAAGQQERAENEKYQHELAAKREEELRTGIRQGPSYTFNETWKQVQLGDQANQRQLSNIHQSAIPASNSFGAVGTMPNDASPRLVHGQPVRGSRFFPAQNNGYQDKRAVTYSHPTVPRSPSPPPAEEYSSYHPAFEGDFRRPTVRFPREKPVVKLPSAEPEPDPVEVVLTSAPSSQQPMTWAARAAMPVPTVSPSLRSASMPIVQNPSWQERFNGLLGKKPFQREVSAIAPSAVASATREPLEVIQPAAYAAVSMPQQVDVDEEIEADEMSSKEVEAEEDLFEDRELASLPTITLPVANLLSLPLASAPRKVSNTINPSTMSYLMLTSNPTTREHRLQDRPQYAVIHIPESSKQIRKDLPLRTNAGPQGMQKIRHVSGGQPGRRPRGGKSRQTSKAI